MRLRAIAAAAALAGTAACGGDGAATLTFSGSAVGAEGAVIRAQLARFAEQHPSVRVELRLTPDAADQRHQLYVQWLNARAAEPDVLQLDIIWTPEFAAAGWIRPLAISAADAGDFFPAALAANRWRDAWFAVPWFVDAGLLYWRTDLMNAPPASVSDLRRTAQAAVRDGRTTTGLVWQGARYEGLITVFVEHLAAFGGGILDEEGRVIVDQPAAVQALTFMRDALGEGIVPRSVLSWQEEQVRFAFQNGQAAFMRNWPYAWSLLQDRSSSAVAGRVGVVPFPPAGPEGRAAAALGGAQLAVNAYTDEPELAEMLVRFLTAPEQMLERARVASQLPSRRSLYDTPELAEALTIPVVDLREALEAAVPRPITPVYSELSELLQVRVHRALTHQEEPDAALRDAAREIRELLERSGLAMPGETP